MTQHHLAQVVIHLVLVLYLLDSVAVETKLVASLHQVGHKLVVDADVQILLGDNPGEGTLEAGVVEGEDLLVVLELLVGELGHNDGIYELCAVDLGLLTLEAAVQHPEGHGHLRALGVDNLAFRVGHLVPAAPVLVIVRHHYSKRCRRSDKKRQLIYIMDGAKDFVNGLFAGWTQVFIMQPFDRIKVMMQNSHQHNTIGGCIREIIKEEGVQGFYKGSLVLLIGIGAMGSIRWGTFENIRKRFKKVFGYENVDLPVPHTTLAGFCTGLISSVLVGPIEHMRTRVQIQNVSSGPKVFNGSLSAAIIIAQKHGLSAIWRGQVATWIRESTGMAPYFTVIEYVSGKLTPPGKTKAEAPYYVPIIAGGLGGTAYWLFNYPIDYVKTRMQSDSFTQPKYKGFIDCFKQEYNKSGYLGMHRGYTICILRSFPVNAGATLTYRMMQRFWQNLDQKH